MASSCQFVRQVGLETGSPQLTGLAFRTRTQARHTGLHKRSSNASRVGAARAQHRSQFVVGAPDAHRNFRAGQRYFFYAYIMLSFVLLWLAAVTRPWLLPLAPSLLLSLRSEGSHGL